MKILLALLALLLASPTKAQWLQQGMQINQAGVNQGFAKQTNCVPPLVCSTNGVVATIDATQAMPTGAVQMYAGPSAPALPPPGWLFCNGASVLRSDYPALYAVIGTTYGAVDGAHFTLPDLQGRVAVGAGAGAGLTARTLAATGGEEAHKNTAAESGVPAHSHSITDQAHTHTSNGYHDIWGTTGNANTLALFSGTTAGRSSAVSSSYTGITGTNNSVAADAAASHNNMQPYVVLNYIIKT